MRNKKILVPIGFLILTIVLFNFMFAGKTIGTVAQQMFAQYPWRSEITQDYPTIEIGYPSTDFGDSFYPNWDFLSDSLQKGVIPFWLPNDFGGSRAIETGLPGLYYPFRIILALFFSTIVQHNIILFSHLLIALLGMYYFLRFLCCSIIGAVYGAVVWGLNGHLIYYISFTFVLIYAAWLPLALLSSAKAVLYNSKKWAIVCGLCIGLMAFGGYANYFYISLAILACWYLYILAQKAPTRDYSFVILPAMTAIIALLVGAAYWMPLLDILPDLARRTRTLEEQIAWAIPISEALRGLVWPKSLSGPVWGPLDFASLLFTGPLTALLCFASLWKPSKVKAILFFGLLISFLFTIGFKPIYILGHTFLPGFGALHPFSHGAYMFSFFASILSAFGLSKILQGVEVESKKIHAIQGLVCILLLATLVTSSFMLLWKSQPVQPTDEAWLYPETPLTAQLKLLQAQTHTRMVPVYTQMAAPIFFGRSHGVVDLKSIFGYESLPTRKQYSIISAVLNYGTTPDLSQRTIGSFIPRLASDRVPVRLLGNLSVRYIVSPPETNIEPIDRQNDMANLELLYRGRDGWIWENKNALSRAFVANEVVHATSEQEALKLLLAKDFNPLNTSVVTVGENALHKDLPPDLRLGNGATTVEFLEDGINSIRLIVQVPSRAMLVLNDIWAPGWLAYVNGEKTPVLKANYAFRGIMVSAGVNEVKFVYRPIPLIAGLVLTYVSTFGIFLILIYFGINRGLLFWRRSRCYDNQN